MRDGQRQETIQLQNLAAVDFPGDEETAPYNFCVSSGYCKLASHVTIADVQTLVGMRPGPESFLRRSVILSP